MQARTRRIFRTESTDYITASEAAGFYLKPVYHLTGKL